MTRRFLPGFSAGSVLFAALALVGAGCGLTAWEPAGDIPGHRACSVPEPVAFTPGGAARFGSLAGALDDTTAAVEGSVPVIEVFFGISTISIGNTVAGHSGPPPAAPPYDVVRWDQAYEDGFGFDLQFVINRPPRGALSLAAGDTFLTFRVLLDNYAGKYVTNPPTGQASYYDDMNMQCFLIGGRTLANPLDARGTLRPYLQYGGGIVRYSEVTIGNLANWQASMAPAWHVGLGFEYRVGNVGVYVEGGVQSMGPPEVDEGLLDDPATAMDETDAYAAQTLVAYPVRIGLMVGF